MVANVIIEELNGAGPSRTDKTSGTIRFKAADNATVDNANTVVVPTSGQVHSYQKWLQLKIDGGSFTQIDNLKVYSDGQNDFQAGSPSEVRMFYAVTGTYATPEQPVDNVDPPQFPATGSPQEDMTDFFTSSSASPIDMDANNPGPYTDGSPSEAIGDFLVLVMQVLPGATQGITSSETLTFAFDEI